MLRQKITLTLSLLAIFSLTSALALSAENAREPNDKIIYPVVRGTNTPNYGKDAKIIRDGKIYDVIPGTTTPNYGSGQYIIREQKR
jgi:hypothetical protein